jgi:ssDNA-binding Zn-finger/Zn-ribbon topoisomerase 1
VSERITKVCPRCGQPLEIKRNHETQQEFLGCSGYRDGCKHTEPLPEHIRLRRAGQRGLFDEEESHAESS